MYDVAECVALLQSFVYKKFKKVKVRRGVKKKKEAPLTVSTLINFTMIDAANVYDPCPCAFY